VAAARALGRPTAQHGVDEAQEFADGYQAGGAFPLTHELRLGRSASEMLKKFSVTD